MAATPRSKAHKQKSLSKLFILLPNKGVPAKVFAIKRRSEPTRINKRSTNRWIPPTNSCWPNGVRNTTTRMGAMRYFLGRNNTRKDAIIVSVNTKGVIELAAAPPPKLKFSGNDV